MHIQKRKLELSSWLNVSSSFRSYWSSWNLPGVLYYLYINPSPVLFLPLLGSYPAVVLTFPFPFGKRVVERPLRLRSICGVRSCHGDRIDRIPMVIVWICLCPFFKTLREQRCCLWSPLLVGSLAVTVSGASPNQASWFPSSL